MRRSLIFLAVFLMISGCAKNASQTRTELLESARSAINEQRFNDAIVILDPLEKDYTVIDLISTAYAGRAGFSALGVYDTIEKNKDKPETSLYEIAKKYQTINIIDSQIALEYIYSISNDPDHRSENMNIKYSSIQLYKISQILLKNITHFSKNPLSLQDLNWDPCIEANLASIDIREIIISINRAILSVKNIQQNIYTELRKIQNQLNIDPVLFEERVINSTDITKLRVNVGEDYSEYVGQRKTYTCDPNSSNMF